MPNYALERSVRGSSERAAGAQTILRLRRAGRASRGPLNADVRHPMKRLICFVTCAISVIASASPPEQPLQLGDMSFSYAPPYIRGPKTSLLS